MSHNLTTKQIFIFYFIFLVSKSSINNDLEKPHLDLLSQAQHNYLTDKCIFSRVL